jgi:hypothetical protein
MQVANRSLTSVSNVRIKRKAANLPGRGKNEKQISRLIALEIQLAVKDHSGETHLKSENLRILDNNGER